MAAPESLNALHDACGWWLRAMEAEGISEQVRQRTLNRILVGDPDGIEAYRVVAEPDPDGPLVSEDLQTGARYVTLKPRTPVARTVHVAPWCMVDYDASGEPVVVEILDPEDHGGRPCPASPASQTPARPAGSAV